MTIEDVNIRHLNSKICIKNYIWEAPYKNFHMIPVHELGKSLALEIKNEENETLAYSIFSSFS